MRSVLGKLRLMDSGACSETLCFVLFRVTTTFSTVKRCGFPTPARLSSSLFLRMSTLKRYGILRVSRVSRVHIVHMEHFGTVGPIMVLFDHLSLLGTQKRCTSIAVGVGWEANQQTF